jgi:hypothetical protein
VLGQTATAGGTDLLDRLMAAGSDAQREGR